MSRSKDGVFDFVVERDGQKVELSDVHFDTEQQDGITLIKYDFVIIGEKPNFLNVVKNSFTQSASVVRMVWLSLFDLVTGRYGMSELAGPVGTVNVIADVTASAASSKNLGSLLTLPALDGGRFFFLLIEAIRRKPINPKYEGYVHAIGFILLMLLMVVVTYNDIVRLIKT